MARYRFYVTLDRHGSREFDGDSYAYDSASNSWLFVDYDGGVMIVNHAEMVEFNSESLKNDDPAE